MPLVTCLNWEPHNEMVRSKKPARLSQGVRIKCGVTEAQWSQPLKREDSISKETQKRSLETKDAGISESILERNASLICCTRLEYKHTHEGKAAKQS